MFVCGVLYCILILGMKQKTECTLVLRRFYLTFLPAVHCRCKTHVEYTWRQSYMSNRHSCHCTGGWLYPAHTVLRCLLWRNNLKFKYLFTWTWYFTPRRTGFDSSQSVWYLWCTKWHLPRLFSEYFCSSLSVSSANAACSFPSTSCSYQMDKWEKPGNLPNSSDLHKDGEHWIANYFYMKIREKLQAQKLNGREKDRKKTDM